MSATVNTKDPRITMAADLIRSGELVAIPTETVYGLAADATNVQAVQKIFALKGRPATNPLICHLASIGQFIPYINPVDLARITADLQKLEMFWPGPLTVVVPKSEKVPDVVTAGTPTVALRIPNHPLTLALLNMLGCPLAAPSANRSNYISPTSAQHVKDEFGESGPFILDGGDSEVGIESTVLSLVDSQLAPRILRQGAISREALQTALGREVSTNDSAIPIQTIRTSPGLLSTHYAPRTPLKLLSTYDFSTSYLSRIGLIAFDAGVAKDWDFSAIEVLSPNRNMRTVAQRLYDSLRKLDTLDLELILIDQCEPVGIGAAIMDRINRAVKK